MQSDVVVKKLQTFHEAVVLKCCFMVHLFQNAPICASTVLECSCCRIHRYVAAPKSDQKMLLSKDFWKNPDLEGVGRAGDVKPGQR